MGTPGEGERQSSVCGNPWAFGPHRHCDSSALGRRGPSANDDFAESPEPDTPHRAMRVWAMAPPDAAGVKAVPVLRSHEIDPMRIHLHDRSAVDFQATSLRQNGFAMRSSTGLPNISRAHA